MLSCIVLEYWRNLAAFKSDVPKREQAWGELIIFLVLVENVLTACYSFVQFLLGIYLAGLLILMSR